MEIVEEFYEDYMHLGWQFESDWSVKRQISIRTKENPEQKLKRSMRHFESSVDLCLKRKIFEIVE
jgi:hypothetical protein